MNIFFETNLAYHCINMDSIKHFCAKKEEMTLTFVPYVKDQFTINVHTKKEFKRIINTIAEQLDETLIQKNS